MQHENREIQKSQSVNLATNFKEDWSTALMTRSFFFSFCFFFFLASDVKLSLKRDTTLNLQVWNRHQANLNTMKPLIKANRLCLLLKPQSTIVMVIFRLNTNRKEHFFEVPFFCRVLAFSTSVLFSDVGSDTR